MEEAAKILLDRYAGSALGVARQNEERATGPAGAYWSLVVEAVGSYDPAPRFAAHQAELAAATFDWTAAECVGFFGYGNGKAMPGVAEYAKAGGSNEMPCLSCPKGPECWEAHKAKVLAIMPGLVEAFEDLAAKHPGDVDALMRGWFQVVGAERPDPYMGLMLTNMQTAAGGAGIQAAIDWPAKT